MSKSIVRRRLALLAGLSIAALIAAGCGGADAGQTSGGGQSLSGKIRVDGSSTVAPLTSSAAELFQSENPDVQISVGTVGTGGGFEKFCAGETDISDASRPIEGPEKKICEKHGVEYEDYHIANDALTVVVNEENTWAKCLTIDQLAKIWGPNSKVNNWNQVDPSFPNKPLELFGPGTDSGTFDYFTEEVNGEEGVSRSDYQASENDNVIVQGVQGSEGSLGYFGYSYYEQNKDTLNAVKIDGGDGCVAPSVKTTQNGTYTPFSRPLFIYPSTESLKKPEVKAFVEFYLENDAQIVREGQFVPLNSEQSQTLQSDLEDLKAQY
jgi:phosphate transport system substrate-binding protein